MNLCMNSGRSRAIDIINSCLILLLSLYFCVGSCIALVPLVLEAGSLSGIRKAAHLVLSVLLTGSMMVLGIICAAVAYRFHLVYSRRYTISDSGITIKYFTSKTHHYRWEDFADIAICDVNHNYGGGFDLVLRLATNRDPYGPLCPVQSYGFFDGYEKWRSETYVLKHYQDVIYITYSGKQYDAVQQYSGMEIQDRRSKKYQTGDLLPPSP